MLRAKYPEGPCYTPRFPISKSMYSKLYDKLKMVYINKLNSEIKQEKYHRR